MAETQNPKTPENLQPSEPPRPRPPPPTKQSIEIETTSNGGPHGSFSGHRVHYPNPPDPVNPDPATLREQWRFAVRQYSRWYSHAWGTAILAGGAFFALGWIIKGGNPLPSKDSDDQKQEDSASDRSHWEELMMMMMMKI